MCCRKNDDADNVDRVQVQQMRAIEAPVLNNGLHRQGRNLLERYADASLRAHTSLIKDCKGEPDNTTHIFVGRSYVCVFEEEEGVGVFVGLCRKLISVVKSRMRAYMAVRRSDDHAMYCICATHMRGCSCPRKCVASLSG